MKIKKGAVSSLKIYLNDEIKFQAYPLELLLFYSTLLK